MADVRLEHVHKYYGRVRAVEDLTLEVRDQELFFLLGPSGCGKSSTMRMIAGLEVITRGDIYIGETRVNDLEPQQRNVAMVFENYALYPYLTAYENIAFPLRVRGMAPAEVDRRVREMAELLELTQVLSQNVRSLSGGQQQRVGVARALVRRPSVLLLDEPISHLEVELRARMRIELKRMQRELAVTAIYVTHDQAEAMAMADRIGVMNLGRLQQVGTPDEIYRHPANLFVAGFVGEPPMNFLAGRLLREDEGMVVSVGGLRIPLPADVATSLERVPARAEVVVGLRPTALELFAAPPQDGAAAGQIRFLERRGDTQIATVALGDTMVLAEVPVALRFREGDQVWVGASPSDLHLFDPLTETNLLGAG
jgi:ABC-type sugar transport system ATPase subunit